MPENNYSYCLLHNGFFPSRRLFSFFIRNYDFIGGNNELKNYFNVCAIVFHSIAFTSHQQPLRKLFYLHKDVITAGIAFVCRTKILANKSEKKKKTKIKCNVLGGAWKNEKLIRARSDLIQQHLVKSEQRPHNRSYRTHVYMNKAFFIYSPFFCGSLSTFLYFPPCNCWMLGIQLAHFSFSISLIHTHLLCFQLPSDTLFSPTPSRKVAANYYILFPYLFSSPRSTSIFTGSEKLLAA